MVRGGAQTGPVFYAPEYAWYADSTQTTYAFVAYNWAFATTQAQIAGLKTFVDTLTTTTTTNPTPILTKRGFTFTKPRESTLEPKLYGIAKSNTKGDSIYISEISFSLDTASSALTIIMFPIQGTGDGLNKYLVDGLISIFDEIVTTIQKANFPKDED